MALRTPPETPPAATRGRGCEGTAPPAKRTLSGRGARPLVFALLGLVLAGCENPFAPPLGDPVSVWSDQTTVGGLLENFRTAYIRRDSLRYAECLACPDFRFNYFDADLGDNAWMPRETDLAATGALFRHFSSLDLRWIGVTDELAAVDAVDSLVSFTVFFELGLGFDVINGHARFTAVRRAPVGEECFGPIHGTDPVFRLLQWDDDL